MKTISTVIILFIALLLIPTFAVGQDLRLEYRLGNAAYRGGDTVVVGIRAGIPSGYHLYGNPLGAGIGKPLNLFINRVGANDSAIDYSIDVPWAEARKGAPKKYRPPLGDWVWAYESEAYFFLKGVLNVEDGVKLSDNPKIEYEAAIVALICRTSCIPVEKRVTFELPVSSNVNDKPAFSDAPKWRARYAKSEPMEFVIGKPPVSRIVGGGGDVPQLGIQLDFSGLSSAAGMSAESLSEGLPLGRLSEIDGGNFDGRAGEKIPLDNDGDIIWDYVPVEGARDYNLLTAVLFALLAGLALNLTPCIFPLLGVRILSFAESARESRRRAVVRSAAFSGGIVAVFLLLAAFAAFAGFSWGQQFQNPTIMVVIIAIIVLFALGMFDFYTMAAPSAVGSAGRRADDTLCGDFLKGAAATVMATPCGGPFLGALLAWALLQKPLAIFMLFALMGVGMALPYVLLSSIGRLQKLLPKPGRWIEDFKHVMGFVLLLFAVNLLKSLDSGLTLTAVGVCLSILCAASVNKRFAPFGSSAVRRLAVVLIAVVILAAGTAVSVVYLRDDTSILNDSLSDDVNSMHIIGYGGINNTGTVGYDVVQKINSINKIGYDSTNNTESVGYDVVQKINSINSIGYDTTNNTESVGYDVVQKINSINTVGYDSINNTESVGYDVVQKINSINTIGYDSINHTQSVDYNDSSRIISINRLGYGNTNHTSTIWNEFSPYALRKAQAEGRSVIVNFTASWCTNCKLNKAAALDAPAARRIYADKNIVLLTADITNRNPQAQSLLSHLGSRSVPFLAIFPANSPRNPVIMRDILSKDKYLKTLRGLP